MKKIEIKASIFVVLNSVKLNYYNFFFLIAIIILHTISGNIMKLISFFHAYFSPYFYLVFLWINVISQTSSFSPFQKQQNT